jgi:nitrogen fixation protein NifZ
MELTHAQANQVSPSLKDDIIPHFRIGQRVRINKAIRNDGTDPTTPKDSVLVEKGAEGYVKHIGDFLQVIRVYDVAFIEEARTYGCREAELEAVEEEDGYDEVEEELRWLREHRAKKAAEKAAQEAEQSQRKES